MVLTISKVAFGAGVAIAAAMWAGSVHAEPSGQDRQQVPTSVPAAQDLTRLSLEELSMVEVTSVSRRPEALGDAAAAIFVISAQDIRRSGAASLPEVLRLAPNLNVQRVNAGDYAISARGFNGFETSNKLLVLIDGRSVYSTLQSGVFWDGRTIMLEDIERIEIISGPGGSLFGANAVNGIVNVITRSAADTQGGLGQLSVGTEDSTLSLRFGGRAGPSLFWRTYLSAFDRDDSFRETGEEATDATSGVRGGFRIDFHADEDRLTLQGEIFDNQVRTNEDFSGTQTRVDGGHIRGAWVHDLAGGELQVSGYYDHFGVTEPGLTERTDTSDISVQHAFGWGDRHEIVWGGGYRRVKAALYSDFASGLVPPERRLSLFNVFVQDQIRLATNVSLTVGAKLEENSFTGSEFLPNVRLAWRRSNGDLIWGAVSRASRTPNRIERDLTLPGVLVGGDFSSETLTAFEAGYRSNPTPNTSVSLSAFYNEYDDLRTVEADPLTVLPLRFANAAQGSSHGVEAWGSWDMTDRWRLSAGAAWLEKNFEVKPGATDIAGLASVGLDPRYQLQLRSQADLTDSVDLDLRARVVDGLEQSGVGGFVEADARLGWHISDRLELAVTGQNLIGDLRLETADPVRRRAFGRSVYASVRVSF